MYDEHLEFLDKELNNSLAILRVSFYVGPIQTQCLQGL